MKLLALLFLSVLLQASEIFPKTVLLDGQTLTLKGTGYRTVTWFKVKVYHAGLYVVDVKADPLATAGLKVVDLLFEHDVGVKDFQKAWREGFEKNCSEPCAVDAKLMQKFLSECVAVKDKQAVRYVLYADKVVVTDPDGSQRTYADKALPQVLLSTWIGKFPPNESLKKGLLGDQS